tara:strand:+ start:542 stop:1720 length:1179 start_codon:yes stop_codon:yes gene_type:complete
MLNNLFLHQKLNFEVAYKLRNKYFIFFPIYFICLFSICLISNLTKLIFNSRLKINTHLFITFTKNQLKVSNFLNKHNVDVHFNFKNLNIKSTKISLTQNLLFFGLINGMSLSLLFKILKIDNFKYFKINWFRICNLVFIDAVLKRLKIKEKLVIIANDHSIYNIFIINWCNINDIKTMYIQHAPVSEKFPPLRCDYNILFSKSSEHIYSKISPITVNYEIYSDFRLINLLKLKSDGITNDNSILICTNELDEMDNVKNYVNFFNKIDYTVTIRKHPADRRDWTIVDTDLSQSSLYEDFKYNKIILCNETALFLEAAVCNKLIYKCNFSLFFDNYGYLKDGLILKQYYTPDELYTDIKNKYISYDRNKLNFYTGDLLNHKAHISKINNFLLSY